MPIASYLNSCIAEYIYSWCMLWVLARNRKGSGRFWHEIMILFFIERTFTHRSEVLYKGLQPECLHLEVSEWDQKYKAKLEGPSWPFLCARDLFQSNPFSVIPVFLFMSAVLAYRQGQNILCLPHHHPPYVDLLAVAMRNRECAVQSCSWKGEHWYYLAIIGVQGAFESSSRSVLCCLSLLVATHISLTEVRVFFWLWLHAPSFALCMYIVLLAWFLFGNDQSSVRHANIISCDQFCKKKLKSSCQHSVLAWESIEIRCPCCPGLSIGMKALFSVLGCRPGLKCRVRDSSSNKCSGSGWHCLFCFSSDSGRIELSSESISQSSWVKLQSKFIPVV